eukprot:CAMPEP_0172936594 /NCGR_PEP_ID=MMETSP1075-20121228/222099_1 /TAXON_ID=2916 /ORGANISM="Ceratium fusus, Strain PA161109" /LENGTH=50 /DNA_ID=CAMNT_0013797967 /DNA_START=407 /DNA_END=559 /DNA_ORIENTATION=-
MADSAGQGSAKRSSWSSLTTTSQMLSSSPRTSVAAVSMVCTLTKAVASAS